MPRHPQHYELAPDECRCGQTFTAPGGLAGHLLATSTREARQQPHPDQASLFGDDSQLAAARVEEPHAEMDRDPDRYAPRVPPAPVPAGRVSPVAHARYTDPATSHQAAATVAVKDGRAAVLELLRQGQATDEQLQERAALAGLRISPSGVRTRRSELVARGLARDTGLRQRTAAGRACTVWEATP